MGYIGYYVILGVFMIIGQIVSSRLKSKMKKYGHMPTSSGLSGAEIAQKMLNDNQIYDVQIVQGQGFLTDHYNPINKVISLSPAIYQGRDVAAAAVASHECGHAVQHATDYKWLQMRSRLVPFVQFGSRFYFWIILAGFFIGMLQLAWVGVGLFAVTTLFTVITLPVEYDASNRALAWLEKSNITRGEEHHGAKDALKWAARTYLVAALASVAQLMYWVLQVMSRR